MGLRSYRQTPEYRAWLAMRERCRNPKDQQWTAFGGRGVTIDPAWDDYLTFLADMGPCPSGYILDRKNPAFGYGPMNCCWALPNESLASEDEVPSMRSRLPALSLGLKREMR